MMKTKKDLKPAREEILLHFRQAGERLRSAKILFKEGLYKDSISRAYYACFEAATGALLSEGIITKTHAGLLQLFSLHFIKERKIGVNLIKMFKEIERWREEADYEARRSFTEKEAREAAEFAAEFIKEVERVVIKKFAPKAHPPRVEKKYHAKK